MQLVWYAAQNMYLTILESIFIDNIIPWNRLVVPRLVCAGATRRPVLKLIYSSSLYLFTHSLALLMDGVSNQIGLHCETKMLCK